MSNRPETRDGSLWGDADGDDVIRRFRALVDVVDGGIFHLDPSGQFVSVDDGFVETTGYERDAILGEHVSTLLGAGSADRLDRAIGELGGPDGEAASTLRATVRGPDGDGVPCELRVRAVAGDGAADGTVGVLRERGSWGVDLGAVGAWTEGEIREHEAEFCRIAEHLDEVVWLRTADQREVLYVNPAFEGVWGRDRERLYEDASVLLESVHPEDRERVRRELDREIEEGYEIEYRIVRPDGEVRWIHDSATPVRDEDGEVYRIVGEARDVTERRRRERTLEERERHRSTLMDNLPGMVYRCRNEEGWPMEFVSEGCRELTGHDPEVLERGEVSFGEDVVHEADRGQLWEDVQQGLADDGTFLVTYRIETTDGEVRWVRERGRGIYDADGDLDVLEGVVIDVSERKRAQQQLAEERDMFAEGPAVVFRWTPDADEGWPVEYVSDNVEDVFGYTPTELESGEVPYTDLLLKEELDRIAREVEENSDGSTERFTHGPYRVRTKDGEIRWVKHVTKIVRDESGEIANYLGYLVDITERKERERELQRYERIVENLPVGVYRNTPGPEGEFVEMNSTLPAIYGADSEDELLEVSVSDLHPDPEQREEFSRQLDREGIVHDVELEQETLDGERIWISVTAIRTEEDGEVYFDGILQDVTDRKERQRALEESEQRYRTLVENFPNGAVGLVDEELRYVTVGGDPRTDRPTTADDLEGEHVREVLSERLADAIEPRYEAAFDGEASTFEFEHEEGDRYSRFHVFPVGDDDGEVFAALGMSQDITDQRRRERELERTKERYRSLAENFPNGGVGVYDEDLRYTLVTGTMWDDIEPDAEDFEGGTIHEVLPPETADDVEPIFRAALEGETGTVVSELGGRTYRVWATPLRDADGEITGGQSFALDVTDRLERERHLERYETIVEAVNDGVYVVDGDGRFTMVNQAYAEMLGYERDELIGEHVSMVADDKVIERANRVEAAMREGADESPTVKADLETASGDRLPAEATFAMLPSVDGGQRRVGVVRDVAERQQRERELAESERRYRVLAEYFPNGLVTLFDHDLTYELAAGQGFDRIPVEPDDLVGESFRDFWNDETAATLEPVFQAALDGEEQSIELEYADREWILHVVPITDEGGDVFAGMTMAQDVTEQKEREQYLEDAKSRLEAATDAGAVGTWEWQIPEDEMTAGKTFAETFGVDPEAAREGVSLDRFVSAIHEADRDRVEAEIQEAVETCGEYEAEYRVRDADGELRWVVARGHVECDEDGEPVRFPGAVTDITERKRAGLELERSNEQLETLFEVLPVGVVVAEADGRIVEANDTAREIWGGDVFDADSIEEYEKYPVRRADTGERVEPERMTLSRVLDGEEVTDPDIYEIDAMDGEGRIVRLEGMPVRDETGAVIRGVVTLTDVTERKEAQRRLEESERRYRTLIENFPNGSVGLFDEELEYTAVGGQLLDTLGMDPEDRVGRRIDELHSEELLQQIQPKFQAALDGEANSFEVEFLGRQLYCHTLPVRNADDEVFAGMLVVQDVTERREYERMLEASNERLEQFAYAASHDLQEPLRMVSSYLQLIDRRYGDDLDADGREFLEFAVDGADRMKEMIDGLLQYSRVETQGEPFEPVDLDDVLADVRRNLDVMIEESDADITAEPLPRVRGDRSQLTQVLQNLLSNAIEYSGDGPPRAHVSAEADGDWYGIAVSDEGIGMDPEEADSVFEVFERLHDQSEGAGTGIGLALCRRIVERHGGDIDVESEPGEGSTFTFTLPAAGDRDD